MTEITDLNIRLYQPGDDEGIVELLKKTFPHWKDNADALNFWRWKYLNTPSGSFVIVVVIDNKIVGCNHFISFKAKLGSEVTSIRWADGLAVDADYRGLGIWTKMRDFRRKMGATTGYTYSTTANPIVSNSWDRRKRGKFPFQVTRMVKIKDIDLHLRMRPMKNTSLVKYGYSGLKVLNSITSQFTLPIKRIDDFKIDEIQKFDEGIDAFWDKIKDDYKFILEKKQSFLNWRLFDPRGGTHVVVQAMKGEEILGFIAMRITEEGGYTEGQIKDLLALKNRLDVTEALMDYACKYFNDLGINTVYYQVVEGHQYQELSKIKGFIDSGSKPFIELSTEEGGEIQFFKNTAPSQVYFNYAETL